MTNSFVIESYSNNHKQMKSVTKAVNDLRNTITPFFSNTESTISDSSVGCFIKKQPTVMRINPCQPGMSNEVFKV